MRLASGVGQRWKMRAAIEGLEPITATLDDQRAGPGA